MKRLFKTKGNLLIVFIMLVVLASVIFSFISFIYTRMMMSGISQSEAQALYVAEAGVNQAIWLLETPTSGGGQGTSWRITGYSQNYGKGLYTFCISDGSVAGQINILCTGEVQGAKKTIAQSLAASGVPGAFNYSVFGGGDVNIGRTYNISGEMFASGNTAFSGSGTAGKVYHSAGKTVTGGGVDGGVPSPLPTFPNLDTSSYTNAISLAGTYTAGNQTYSNTTVNLGGGTLNVNGNVNLSTVRIVGPGKIVATGTVTIGNGPNSTDGSNITIISGSTVSAGGNTILNNITYYGQTGIAFTNTYRGSSNALLSPGNISLTGDTGVSGLVYSKSGSVTLGNTCVVTGSIVAANGVTATKADVTITHDNSAFASNMPSGFPPEQYNPKKGSWTEQ